MFKVENRLRLLKLGQTRLGTASTDWSESERTRRFRETEAQTKEAEREALRRAAAKDTSPNAALRKVAGRSPDEVVAEDPGLFRPESKKRPVEST
jgi:hypothetical protein